MQGQLSFVTLHPCKGQGGAERARPEGEPGKDNRQDHPAERLQFFAPKSVRNSAASIMLCASRCTRPAGGCWTCFFHAATVAGGNFFRRRVALSAALCLAFWWRMLFVVDARIIFPFCPFHAGHAWRTPLYICSRRNVYAQFRIERCAASVVSGSNAHCQCFLIGLPNASRSGGFGRFEASTTITPFCTKYRAVWWQNSLYAAARPLGLAPPAALIASATCM